MTANVQIRDQSTVGVFIQNKVALICGQDESNWTPVRTDSSDLCWYDLNIIPSEDYRADSKKCEGPAFEACKHSNGGKLIELDTDGYGVIAVDAYVLPKSIKAVVRLVQHLQGEDFHFIEAIPAAEVESHDWSLENKDALLMEYCPPAPDDFTGDTDDWWDSPLLLQDYQFSFNQLLGDKYNNAVKEFLKADTAEEITAISKAVNKVDPITVAFICEHLGGDIGTMPAAPTGPTPEEKQALEARRKVWAEENEERRAEQRKQDAINAAEKEAEMASRNDEQIFLDAMNDCYLDDIYKEADRFKELIISNITELAGNHTEDNPAVFDNPPAWLTEIFDKHNAYYDC